MSLEHEEATTKEFYDMHAAEWVAGHQTERFWGGKYDEFKQLLGEEAVLEIGVGGGRDAAELKVDGYVGVDIAMAMLLEARRKLPGETLINGNAYELPFLDDSFGGFWAAASLLHLKNIDKALLEIRRVVRAGGVGFISVKKGVGEQYEEKTGKYYRYYQDEEMREILAAAGMEVVGFEEKSFLETGWLVYLLQVQ